MNDHTEKAPLLPVSETTSVLSGPEEEATRLHEILKQRAVEWREANIAYQNAWVKTKQGRWVKRINTIVLTIVGLFSAFILCSMLGLIVYAAWFDPDPEVPVRNGTLHGHPHGHNDYGYGYGGMKDWSKDGPSKIPLEAHIMSKCPDSRDCLRDLVLPAMQNVSGEVDFKLSYIGTATNHDDGVLCMHGPGECLGDILELCAADLYPDPKTYLGFTMCMSNEYDAIPEHDLVHDCALEHGMSFEKLNKCASRDDGYGMKLLRDSVNRSKEADVQTSCTIRLGGKTRCVRDGGEWFDCEGGHEPKDLVRDIMELKSA